MKTKNYEAEFKKFQAEAEKLEFFSEQGYALESALLNASETEDVEHFSAEFWRVAYMSIACTDTFNINKSVRDWFEALGYEW